ncbi:2-succinyl-6-hydroxy-2,4-cyclohexadiene-1-carboxylate synthase [Metabacillus sp. RGM 3146]|uniref:2-succinyl-6-hydroxy-2, 4-cyclohexadiene-1-carboxylate synthase n=1 Tax=Metabacillus sp. RGM 3146 TaxID=3401092 RepID=UPI003B9ADD43
MIKNVKNLHYHIEIYGEGEPLVFLHGFTGSSQNWIPFVDSFPGFRLILIDIIGHGKSASPKETEHYSMMNAVEDLKIIVEELAGEPVSLLGYSMGGRLALSFAMTYPEWVEKVILESSSPGLKAPAERKKRMQQDQSLADEIQVKGISAFVDKWENISLFETQKRLPEKLRKCIREQRLQNVPEGLAGSLIGMGTGAQPSWWDRLNRFNKKVLLISGQWDTKFCMINEEMQSLLPEASLQIIKDSGHAVHVEQPQIFGKIVNEFLTQTN